MAKPRTTFTCQSCGFSTPRWLGKCPECSTWSSFVESVEEQQTKSTRQAKASNPIQLKTIQKLSSSRIKTSISEIDQVLGGGVVIGSTLLLGGDPGIGKSTLILQVADKIQEDVLYVSAEESPQQIKLRADRLGIQSPFVTLISETSLESILATLKEQKPALVIIDSIQTIASADLSSPAGSVSQVRECANRLTRFAKKNNIPIILIGHITKEGNLAGPKTLEHLVDVVLTLEGEKLTQFRILRAQKNRYGNTQEIGLLQMTNTGLQEISDPTKVFLHQKQEVPGSSIICSMEGNRSILLELQALTTTTLFGMPRRNASGIDIKRLHLLSAVLIKQCNLQLGNQDIYLNITGGLQIKEPAIDLGICLSLISSMHNKTIPKDTVIFGEVGLLGEIRPVSMMGKRIQEIEKRGFKNVICPKLQNTYNSSQVKISQFTHIRDVMKSLF